MDFDGVYVVSLERRPDRLEKFMSRVPRDFQYGEITAVKAVDGKLCRHPAWWHQGGGAWGCYRSHIRIIEEALNNRMSSVLIFEDDATFCENFTEAAEAYFDALPENWRQAYLGGQHLKKAIVLPGKPLVVQAQNINRTHAYALNTREGLEEVYRWLNETVNWPKGNHVDHHYGRLHKRAQSGYYAPAQWLCGQAEGVSDISWKNAPERWWLRKQELPEDDRLADVDVKQPSNVKLPFIAVVGLHRSGSSCVAMVCHKLGINMGDKLQGYESKNGGGGEAVGLAGACEWAAKFPSTKFSRSRAQITDRLRRWIYSRVQKSRRHGFKVGGKYPHLCAMGDELIAACGDSLKIIHCDRPLEDSIESLKARSRASKGWLAATDKQCEDVQNWLWRGKQKLLGSVPSDRVLDVKFNELMSSPESVIDAIIGFTGIRPSKSQRQSAIDHVKKRDKAAA